MKVARDKIWTWFLPDKPAEISHDDWVKNGGKWIVFDGQERVNSLAEALQPYIDAGTIVGAKCWNGNPSAINVYCLDRDRMDINLILDRLGAAHSRVLEYDFALGKNLRKPFDFTYSWTRKFITILRSYRLPGTINLMRELFIPGRDGR